MFRRQCFQKAGPYRLEFLYAQDYDLWLRMAQYYDLDNIPEFLYKWRLVPDGASMRGWSLQSNYAFLATRLARERDESGVEKTILKEAVKLIRQQDKHSVVSNYVYWSRRCLWGVNLRQAIKFWLFALRQDPVNGEAWKLLPEIFCAGLRMLLKRNS